MRRRHCIAACWILYAVASFAQDVALTARGGVTPKVLCSSNPQQSYAVYLPSQYSPNKRWPIVYVFDPGARGQSAVEAIQSAAEKYGYIVVGSNNSRNGDDASSTDAADAMWKDTQLRFAIDERRRYFAGMSGGARIATALAMSCNGCVAGVIANAAGFPQGRKPSNALKFAYFAALGNADFNFLEFVDLRHELEESGMPYRIRMFDGQHGWAPPEVWQEALNWMDVQAMRAGALPRDPGRIQQSYQGVLKQADQFRSEKNFLAASREVKFAAREFSGLTNISTAETMESELAKDKRVRSGEKQELSAAADQSGLMEQPTAQMDELARGNLDGAGFMALRDSFASLLKQVQRSRDPRDTTTLVRRRALSGLVVYAFESGRFNIDRKNYEAALRFFDLAIAGSENSSWGHYQRARAYAALGDKKHVIAELKSAATAGFSDVSALTATEFQAFQSDPEFQTIVASARMRHN